MNGVKGPLATFEASWTAPVPSSRLSAHQTGAADIVDADHSTSSISPERRVTVTFPDELLEIIMRTQSSVQYVRV
jgi:hypothetical protein